MRIAQKYIINQMLLSHAASLARAAESEGKKQGLELKATVVAHADRPIKVQFKGPGLIEREFGSWQQSASAPLTKLLHTIDSREGGCLREDYHNACSTKS